MKASAAIDRVDPQAWRNIDAARRLALLETLSERIAIHASALTMADAAMKGIALDDPANVHQAILCTQATIMPVASNIAAAIELYRDLVAGGMTRPVMIRGARDGRCDIQVSPRGALEQATYGTRRDYLRVKGIPSQTSPLDKAGGIIAVLGAGNYSSAFEMIRALFFDNCVVVHKPHPVNAASDAVWEQVLQPLVECRALAFCDADDGPALAADPRLAKIYFTGGTAAARAIMASASAEFVSECGGNNPCIIVPGDRPWSNGEITHQALHIASWAKSNGGAVCGRPQTLVTCRNWPQRESFLAALTRALAEDTPGMSTWYPGAMQTFETFCVAHPEGTRIRPEGAAIAHSDVLLVTDLAHDSFAVTHEAFCQVIGEVTLDTPAQADAFLDAAVVFANERLPGSLGAAILVDEDTLAAHPAAIDRAVDELAYGGIAVNTMPPDVWRNPALTWGGNEEGKPLVSGHGNFGNLLGFENVEKSIVRDHFMAPGHLRITSKRAFAEVGTAAVTWSIFPAPDHLAALGQVVGRTMSYPKDF